MSRSKQWPKKAKDIKGKVAVAELKRAHLIIVLLAFAVVPLLAVGASAPVQLDPVLSAVLIALLILLGLISLLTVVALNKR